MSYQEVETGFGEHRTVTPKSRFIHSCGMWFDTCDRCGQRTYCESCKVCQCAHKPISQTPRSTRYEQIFQHQEKIRVNRKHLRHFQIGRIEQITHHTVAQREVKELCPVCGRKHSKLPKQCILTASSRHAVLCGTSLKHQHGCIMEDFQRYLKDWMGGR